jgi:hypothetical protein
LTLIPLTSTSDERGCSTGFSRNECKEPRLRYFTGKAMIAGFLFPGGIVAGAE